MKRCLLIVFYSCICVVTIPQAQNRKSILSNSQNPDYSDYINRYNTIIPTTPITPDRIEPGYGTYNIPFQSTQKTLLSLTGFDQDIDEDKYILGTGDGFTIYLWGSVNNQLSATVDQEGNCIIPSVGAVNIKSHTLREGRKKIEEKILSVYKKVAMSVILTTIRRFKVYVLGEAKLPGFYEVNGATRVSDVIEIAGGLKNDTIADLRGIEVENENFPKKYADLALFYNSNIPDKNPYLLEGDRVFIPKGNNIISIHGNVNYPGTYKHMPSDSLITVIHAAGGLSREADSSKIFVFRFVDDKDSLILFQLSFYDSSVYNLQILKDDRILVHNIPDYREHRQVVIRGEINYPGVYPIRKDKTKLKEIITIAGGLTEDAYLRGSKIIRKRNGKLEDREYQLLKTLPIENLSPVERNYLKTKQVEEKGRVSIDFEGLISNGNDVYNILLTDKDEIIIAEKELSVKVLGAVVVPGLVSYREGAGYEYYIEQAGGVTSEAKRGSIRVIKGGTETWLKPQRVERLEAGDAIWVPERPYINKLSVSKDILLVMGSIATLIISAITIQQMAKAR